MATVMDCIDDKYSYDLVGKITEHDEDFDFIVFVSNSPECKKGMLPPIITLCDYNINSVGCAALSSSRLGHVAELDLTDNLLSDWCEVFLLLESFPSLEFLNLSNNMLSEPMDEETEKLFLASSSNRRGRHLHVKKLVLNGNKVDWATAKFLAKRMPTLEQLYLCGNALGDPPEKGLEHPGLTQLFLGCNHITRFEALGRGCPSLRLLLLSECPVTSVPSEASSLFPNLASLNLSTTEVSAWEEVDRLRLLPALSELRLRRCPVLRGLTAHERRTMLIARLPNVRILNGGDVIPDSEREDAERAFIRYYLDSDSKPSRYDELVSIHGRLDPLVEVNLRPSTHVKVKISHKEALREEVIKVYQTVQQFKGLLQQWFGVAPQNMKLYYCDKDLVEMAGPEEMKWPQKELYTYNVQNGDKFILDEKVSLGKVRSRNSSSSSLGNSPGYKLAFSLSPRPFAHSPKSSEISSGVARNLFGKSPDISSKK